MIQSRNIYSWPFSWQILVSTKDFGERVGWSKKNLYILYYKAEWCINSIIIKNISKQYHTITWFIPHYWSLNDNVNMEKHSPINCELPHKYERNWKSSNPQTPWLPAGSIRYLDCKFLTTSRYLAHLIRNTFIEVKYIRT